MHISWLGKTCVKLQTKNLDADVTILIDGYKPKTGAFPRSLSPDIALFSNGVDNAITLSQDPFIVSALGENEVKNIMIYSIPDGNENIIFKIHAEGMNLVHLGKISVKPSDDVIEKIMNADILFIPVGEKKYLDAKIASLLVSTLEPRIVIPLGLKCDNEPDSDTSAKFASESGLLPENAENKAIIKKKDLPQEQTKLLILEKES